METHRRETLEPDSAPSDSSISEQVFDGSSSSSPEMPVSEENLSEARGERSLVAASNQNESSPHLGKKAQDDRSLVLSASNHTGSPTILPPINETLGWSPSKPAQTEPVDDDYPNFSICSDDEALQVDPFTSSPDRLLGNNLLDSSSSRWSSSHGSAPWPSSSSSRGTWSASPSSEETKSSALSFTIGDIKPYIVVCFAYLLCFQEYYIGMCLYIHLGVLKFFWSWCWLCVGCRAFKSRQHMLYQCRLAVLYAYCATCPGSSFLQSCHAL